MNEEDRLVPVQVTDAIADGETRALTPVAIEELTTKVVAALDVIAAIIPDLVKPHPATEKKVRGGRTVPREAVVSVVAMVESSPELQSMHLLDTVRAHEILEFDDGYRVLDERLEMLRRQVRYTAEARWAELASRALDAFHMAEVLVKRHHNTDLAQHVANIRRHLGRRNTKKEKEPKPK